MPIVATTDTDGRRKGKIGFLAANDGVIEAPHTFTSAALMRASGRNVGNLAFWYAARRLFDEEVVYLPWKSPGTKLPRNLKAFVIPAANFIGSHANLAPLVEMVREIDAPCLIMGLGAQSESEAALPKVGDATVSFLKEVGKRTPFLAVRGEYTAKVIREFGVANVKVLGCPSILMSGELDLGRRIAARIEKLDVESVAVHGACRKANVASVERELVRTVMLNPGSVYVVQRPPELIAALYREDLSAEDEKYVSEMARFLAFRSAADFKAFIRRHGYVPTSIDSWSSLLRRFSCTINTRIHGTIVGLQTGVPSLCVHHDTRTAELATRLRLPMLSIARFIEHRYDIKGLFKAAGFDGAAFDGERRAIAREYLDLFGQLDLTPSRHLRAFVESPTAARAA